MTVFVGQAKTNEFAAAKIEITYMLATGGALLTYVAIFTVMKYRRVYREQYEYKMIKECLKDIPADEAARRMGF